jgi:hypothetical protein
MIGIGKNIGRHVRGSTVTLAGLALPVDKQGDGVLGLGNTVVRLASRNTGGGTGDDTSREHAILDDPTADVDVVRGKVVAETDVI